MDVIVTRQAALDAHTEQVTACVRVPGADGVRVEDVKQFKTTVGGLLVLANWLKAHRTPNPTTRRTTPTPRPPSPSKTRPSQPEPPRRPNGRYPKRCPTLNVIFP